ncbi:hypothetical protein UFOVP116_364 [uncultured Caudovirales phage]|uniref:Uncharacterized protein n=1 Tax=uncultured Caudovirales phage TaxID=2100421 RepID=A0A6J5LF87_9CAUD|nr:hypothetical protein UFOVP116_364 [uncultured Caudovirales phage]
MQEIISEIGYADKLSDLSVSDAEIIQMSVKDGTIGQRPVMKCVVENTTLFYFAEGNKIAALILLEDDKLRAIKNFTSQPELIRALLNYIVNMCGQTIKITPNEPLTAEGMAWLIRTIKNQHGIRVTDLNGDAIDAALLHAEWESARSTRGETFGSTGLIISESTAEWKQRLNENEKRLMPYIFFDFSNSEIIKMKENTMKNAIIRGINEAGLKFQGGFPDVDHMHRPVIRDQI